MADTYDLEVSVDNRPPDTRLQTLSAACNAYNRLRKDDEEAAASRARQAAMFDNQPPYPEAKLRAMGQAHRTNLNFGQAEGYLEEALTSYLDLIDSTETLLTVKTGWTGAEPDVIRKYEGIMSQEISKMIRGWTGFLHRHLLNATYFVQSGASATYFPNSWTWKWNVARLGEILFPRKAKTDEEDLELVAIVQDYEAHELWRFIEDEEAAEKMGWNVAQVKALLATGSYGTTSPNGDWERFLTAAREFDLQLCGDSMLRLVHLYVREIDGKMSHYIFEEGLRSVSPSERSKKDFLFSRPREYNSLSDFLTVYCYGVGTTGAIRAVRGLGYRIFAQIQTMNRLHSNTIDGAMLSSALMLKPTDAQALKTSALSFFGPYAVLNPGMRVEDVKIPNLQSNTLPVLANMAEMIAARKAHYTGANALPKNREMTKGEVSAILDNASSLSALSQLLYYEPEDRKYQSVVRRLISSRYVDELDGGRELRKLKQTLQAKGVPEEAFKQIIPEGTKATRALGGGSASHRDAILRDLTDISPSYDTVGRRRLMRWRTATRVGWDRVDEFLPEAEINRESLDYQVAILENFHLRQGQKVAVSVNNLHLDHLRAHEQAIMELIDQAQQGEPLEKVVQELYPLHEHAVQHLELAGEDPTSKADLAAYRQSLQQTGEIIINGLRRLEKLRREGAEQAPQQPGAEDAQLGEEMKRKVIEHNLKLELMQQDAETKRQIAIQKADTERQIKDANAAAELRRKAGLTTN